jgi:hypothetical protein
MNGLIEAKIAQSILAARYTFRYGIARAVGQARDSQHFLGSGSFSLMLRDPQCILHSLHGLT